MAVRLWQQSISYAVNATATAAPVLVSVIDVNQAGKVPDRIGMRVSVAATATAADLLYGFAACWDSAGSDLVASNTVNYYYCKPPGAVAPLALYSAASVTAQDVPIQILPYYVLKASAAGHAEGFPAPYMGFVVDKTSWAKEFTMSVTVGASG